MQGRGFRDKSSNAEEPASVQDQISALPGPPALKQVGNACSGAFNSPMIQL